MVKLLPLKGPASLNALQACSMLLMGLKMIPENLSISYVDYFDAFKEKTDDEKESLIRQAVALVKLEKDEIESIVAFAADKNGIPYTKVNIGNMGLLELHETIVAVCCEIGRININLLSEAEKKKYRTSRLMSGEDSLSTPTQH